MEATENFKFFQLLRVNCRRNVPADETHAKAICRAEWRGIRLARRIKRPEKQRNLPQ
jgi:hypothetical protein